MADKERLVASYKAAVTAHQAHDLDRALEHYRECVAIQPLPQVLNNMAAILLSKGNKAEAETSWRSAVELNPSYAEAHYNLAVLLSESGDTAKLDEASTHCEAALEHREGYVQAHHLMGNIRMSQGAQGEALTWYAKAEALAGSTDGGGGGGTSAQSAAGGAGSSSSGTPPSYRWDGVEVGHTRTLRLPSGDSWEMETVAMRPLAFLVRNFLTVDECERLISLARPKLRQSLLMGNASASERTSESVFLPASEDTLLSELQSRLAAVTQLPLSQLQRSEDVQVVHYTEGAHFGMHHDSSRFLPRYATAFYYLNDVGDGGETAFPAADGAMSPTDAMSVTDPARHGLVVKPERGAALLWYNHESDGSLDAYAVHSGCKVMSGDKWGANHWIRYEGGTREAAATTGDERASAEGSGEERADAGGAEEEGGAGRNAAKNKKKREKAAAKRREKVVAEGDATEATEVS